MKHTPAPWKVMPAQKGKLGGIEVATDKPWLIRDLICMMPHGPEQAQAEANARLIAAAPELLEALQNICKYGQASQLGSDAYAQLDQADVLSKAALAAIAKATIG